MLSLIAALIPAVSFDGRPLPAPRLAEPPSAAVASARSLGSAAIVDGALSPLTESELFDRLAQSDAVYVGETHDQASHHQVQLAVLDGLLARRPELVVGLEMVEAPDQAVLDEYLSGRLSDDEFKKFWERSWRFSYELYRPILERCRAKRVPVKALNAPRTVIARIAKVGLGQLTPQERARLPATVSPIRDPRYLAYIRKSLAECQRRLKSAQKSPVVDVQFRAPAIVSSFRRRARALPAVI